MVKPIILYPSEILREKTTPIMGNDWPADELIKNLIDTMIANHAVGIAAPQIGISKSVCIIGDKFPTVLINPRIIKKSTSQESTIEGCLSLPEISISVQRPISIGVELTDTYGYGQILYLYGPMARIAQHEIDHLNGKLIIDYTHT